MTITITQENTETIFIDDDGVKKTVPRSFNNPTYRILLGETYQDIKRNGTQYLAFPFLQIINSYVFVVFSEGDAHGDSDRQIIARKSISDLTNQSISWDTETFFENDTGVYGVSLLNTAMNNGDVFVFKTFIASKNSGIVTVQTTVTVTVSGYSDSQINGTYALWSKPRYIAGKWYRTGYATVSGYQNSVLFESTNLINWTIKGVLAKGVGVNLLFNESDVVETTSGNYLAVIREDSGAGRPLYTATSNDLITWSSLALSTQIEGVQPNLIKLASGTILLSCGDRTDRSGFDAGGIISNAIKSTGISIYKMISPYTQWGVNVQIDKTWSTDGGQPFTEEYSTGNIITVYYNSTQPTADLITEPGIRFKAYTENNLV